MLNTLHVVESGLIGARVGAQTSTNNTANENVAGYVKRTTQINEAAQTDSRLTGRGVSIGDTIRNTNDFIYKNYVGETTSLSYYEELSTMLGSIENMFQETDDSGFSKDLDAYFQSLENLKSNPQNVTYQEDLKTRASIIVDDMKTLYTSLNNEEAKLKSDLKADVRDINRIVQNIANINEHLGKSNTPQLTLLDKRDALEKELASLVDITVSKDFGDYQLKIGNVTAVRNDNVREFSYGEANTAQIDRFVTADIPLNPSGANPNDKLVYEINNLFSVEVKYGETVDGNVVDETNILDAVVYKINNDPDISNLVTATINASGNLEIVSNKAGMNGEFDSALKHFTDTNSNNAYEVALINKSERQSVEAKSESFIKSYDEKITLSNGSALAKIENLDSSSSHNIIQNFKDSLDTFAATLADMSKQYIVKNDGNFVYGEKASINSGESYNNGVTLGLFTGSSVKTLQFNNQAVNQMEQKDYDYLASFSYKNDILFKEEGQQNINNNYEELTADGTIGTSFSKFFQSFQIDIANFKANNDFAYDTQQTVTQSLKNSYDKMVKVDPDEEMLNLMKFQAAYEANAKLATVLQDMISTTLNMVSR
ncbi:MAG: flagellar basal body rod C-terminal domain-containing protein [Arcobacteraceae bacterium]|nr:flagellar basal body rod C-terminal domain-containing protein [Arcobacteraceae bacterium]